MPTRRGITVGVAGALLLAAGILAGYRELAALGAIALLALAVAFGWAGWPPKLVVARTIDPDRVERGEPCHVSVELRSTARWRGQLLSGVEHLTRAGTPGQVPVPAVRLRPGATARTEYPLPTHRRGVLDVGPMEVARQDPLGLVGSSRRYGGSTRVWVHPRSHRLLGVPVGSARSLDGVVDAVQYGSITFHALREYVPGDDLRHVHWRTSARVGQLMVREHVDTSLPRIVILVDDRSAAHRATVHLDSLEETAEAAASVLLAALRAELTVELHTVSGTLVADQTAVADRSRRYLDALAELRRHDDAALPRAVQKLRGRHRGDTLVLLTGSGSAGRAGAAGELDSIGLLRDVYPTVVVGVLGETEGDLAALPGVITLTARTAEEFAGRWDGVTTW
jgi:uncharacterized protein (DUF58 family)